MDVDRRIAAVAARQFGLITWAQALEAGMAGHQIRARVAAGRWVRVHVGVYAVAGTPSSYERRLLAACLAAGPGALASHRSAAQIWGLDGIERGFTEITVPTSHTRTLEGVLVHRTKDLRPGHATVRRGIPVTNPMRTIVDLGLVVPRWQVRDAMDDALGRQLVTVTGLVRIWRDVARQGRNGSGVLRELLDGHLPPPKSSKLEGRMLQLHRNHGLPEPKMEYGIRDESGRFIGRVDFCHPDQRLVIEVDGYEKRTAMKAFVHDRRRDRWLKAVGWTVIHYTWWEVVYAPKGVAAEIAEFLESASPECG